MRSDTPGRGWFSLSKKFRWSWRSVERMRGCLKKNLNASRPSVVQQRLAKKAEGTFSTSSIERDSEFYFFAGRESTIPGRNLRSTIHVSQYKYVQYQSKVRPRGGEMRFNTGTNRFFYE